MKKKAYLLLAINMILCCAIPVSVAHAEMKVKFPKQEYVTPQQKIHSECVNTCGKELLNKYIDKEKASASSGNFSITAGGSALSSSYAEDRMKLCVAKCERNKSD